MLELMIGKFVGSRDSISLSSIPGAWADMPESTPLISVSVREGRLWLSA